MTPRLLVSKCLFMAGVELGGNMHHSAKAESGHVLGLVFRDLRAAYASVAQARVWACEEGPKTGARMTSMTRTESHL